MDDGPSHSVDFRVDDHRGEHRLLLVFAPEMGGALRAQTEHLEGQAVGFRERDLLLLTVTGDEEGTMWQVPGGDSHSLTDASVHRLYDQFGVPADAFRVLLVGKDGTEKRRDAEPVRARSIFDTIDAMPMRQRELRERTDAGAE